MVTIRVSRAGVALSVYFPAPIAPPQCFVYDDWRTLCAAALAKERQRVTSLVPPHPIVVVVVTGATQPWNWVSPIGVSLNIPVYDDINGKPFDFAIGPATEDCTIRVEEPR